MNPSQTVVHCRTGSLEIFLWRLGRFCSVHCRTGSLESTDTLVLVADLVHCRTGSLEIAALFVFA